MKNRGFLVTFLPYTFITICHYFYLGERNKNSWNCNICLHFTYLLSEIRNAPTFSRIFLLVFKLTSFLWFLLIFFCSASSRRNSISKLPWPEPSPVRDLPPAAPKPKIKHYPLPPPRYEEGMIALSRRLRNRSASPAPNYSELELSNRPALVPAALGRPSPSREMIRMTMCGPPLRQYNYGRNIWERLRDCI